MGGVGKLVKWFCLLLLLLAMGLTLKYAPQQLEDRLQGKVVRALADEQLSVVRVETSGLDMLLTGPADSVKEAALIAKNNGARVIYQRTIAFHQERLSVESNVIADTPSPSSPEKTIIQSSARAEVYSSDLFVSKDRLGVAINGTVPTGKIKNDLAKTFTSLLEPTDHVYSVTVDRLSEKPVWYLQDLPLMIPFLQWVEEGQLAYIGNQIRVSGIVSGEQAQRAFDEAVANLPMQFTLDKQLRVGRK